MSEGLIQISDGIVPSSCNPQEDYKLIFDELLVGNALRERAFYRIWRLRNSGGWKDIIGSGGERYQTWDDFVNDIVSVGGISVGRQTIYNRMRVYDQLAWIGYSDAQILAKMASKPSLYRRALDLVMDWDFSDKRPRRLAISGDDASGEPDVSRRALRKLIADVESFPRQVDALRYIEESVLLEPVVRIYYDVQDSSVVVYYARASINQNGQQEEEESGTIKFFTHVSVPDWLSSILDSRFSKLS